MSPPQLGRLSERFRGLITRARTLDLLVAIVVSAPMVFSPWRLVGHEDADVWNHAWGAWWFGWQLRNGELPFFTDRLGWPDGGTLWYIDPIGALVGFPFVLIFGAAFAYNLVVVVYLAAASAAARGLATRLGAEPLGARLAGVAAVATPYLVSELHNGVSEALGVAWGVFALSAGIDALALGAARGHLPVLGAWIRTGTLLALTTLGSYYYGIAATLALVLYSLPSLVQRKFWARLPFAVVGAVWCLALVYPVYWAIERSVNGESALVNRPDSTWRPEDLLSLQAHNAVDPRTFVAPGSFQSVDLLARGEPFYHSSYFGLFALALALLSLRPRVLFAAAGMVLLSLGPWLWWDGDWWRDASGSRLALPYRALLELLPASSLTHPQRFSYMAIVLCAAAAGVGLSRIPQRYRLPLLVVVLFDGLVLGPAPWPLAMVPAQDHRAAERLAGGTGGVLDLPSEVGRTMASSRYLYDQTVHSRPIPYVPDVRVFTSPLLHVLPGALLMSPSLPQSLRRDVLGSFLDGVQQVDTNDLVRAGIAHVVVHRELDRGSGLCALLEAQLTLWFGPGEVLGPHVTFSTAEPKSGRVILDSGWEPPP